MSESSYTLTETQLYDLELLLNGALDPLKTYMCEKDYYSILETMHLADGTLFPLPIVLRLPSNQTPKLGVNLSLKDHQGITLAKLTIIETFKPNVEKEATAIYGCLDDNHDEIRKLLTSNDICVSGILEKVRLPIHYDFKHIRLTPYQTKRFFKDNNWKTVVGFQTRNPMHRSHYELTRYAMNEISPDCKLLLHPVVGPTQSGDIPYRYRVKCYQQILKHYPTNSVLLSLLPLAMRMAGPREAVLHALIRKNYGCTHFIVGRDHAGPSKRKKDGSTYFGPYDAQDLLKSVSEELGIEIVTSEFIVYEPETSKYYQLSKVPKGLTPLNISGTQLRQALQDGTEIPNWFSFKDVVDILRKSVKKGFCMYFTGLSGSGKSTIANALKVRLEEFILDKEITILDGDQIRLHLSKGLTFSKEDRSMNVRRIGYVASEIVKHGGICLVANIAPFKEDRDWNRELISKYGGYFEVFVSTSLEQCEKRDLKGLYKMAREGKIKKFTGISDPYEEPENADFVINSSDSTNIADLVQYLIDGMKVRGYIAAGDGL